MSDLQTSVDKIQWHDGRIPYLLFGDGGKKLGKLYLMCVITQITFYFFQQLDVLAGKFASGIFWVKSKRNPNLNAIIQKGLVCYCIVFVN